MQGKEFLQYVWSLQPDGYATLVYRKGTEWLEFHFHFPNDWDSVAPLPEVGDLYFCPNLFSEPARKKELALPSRVMYQDLDEVRPDDCPIYPSLYWETSFGRWQGIWIADAYMEPVEFSAMNRALNRACQADPGTWNLTRLLRVPGSHNQKRSCDVSPAVFMLPRAKDKKLMRAAG